MEIINGSCSWKLKIKRCDNYIKLLRAFTCESRAVLPDSLFSLPIKVIGDHAFAYGSRDIEGEEIEIRCGIQDKPFDNSCLSELTLPSGTEVIENYAFLNCRELETLRLSDTVKTFGCEMFMNCRKLTAIELSIPENSSRLTLSAFSGCLTGRIRFTIIPFTGPSFSFVVPEYFEDYEENAPNHDFTLHVTGGGVAYRMSIKNGAMDMKTYDSLWERFLSKYHEPDTALLLAWNRLRYPEQLDRSARDAYADYLLMRSDEVFSMLLKQQDITGTRIFADLAADNAEILSRALDIARSMKRTEAVAVLLEKQRTHIMPADDFDFDL